MAGPIRISVEISRKRRVPYSSGAMRIRPLLFLAAAAVLVPGFLAAIIAIEKVKEAERETALRGLHETVRATALLIDREIQGSLGTLSALGNSPHLQNDNLASFYKEALAVDHQPYVWTLLFDEEGTQKLNTSLPFGTPSPPASQQARERVSQVLSTGRPLVTDLFIGPVTKRLITTVYVRAKAASARPYVVAQAFAVDRWRKTALQPRGQADWIVAVLDRQGRFIARSHQADSLLGQSARPELVAAAAAAPEGLIRHRTLENVDAYDAFVHSELTGWTIAVAAPVETIESSAWQAVSWLVAGLCMALGGALAVAGLIGRRFVQALAVTSQAAAALGNGRQPEVKPTTVHEINVLNEALLDAGRLLSAERQTREQVEAERAELLRKEILAREKAQKENAAKDQFLAMLGHELRNPLAGIAGATTLLMRGRSDEASLARYLGIIDRQNRHLTRIIDDLLEVSRAMSGKIVLSPAPMDLSDCVNHCVDALRTSERAQGHPLVMETQATWVNADAVRMEQIVNNLVTNALKFSPPGGTVWVRLRPTESQAVLEISDEGAGIGADLLPHVFEPFVQGPNLPGRLQSGLGIGLALVKQLVRLHGGEVHAHSQGEGLGSTFTVTLPRMGAQAPSSTMEPRVKPSGCRVLVVDDNPDARLTTVELLRNMGYEVEETADGPQTLARLTEWQPDVIVMDIGLPGRDGYAVAADLRRRPELDRVSLIALTGYGQDLSRREAVASKFDDHLVKPVKPDRLMATIERQLRTRQPGRSPPPEPPLASQSPRPAGLPDRTLT